MTGSRSTHCFLKLQLHVCVQRGVCLCLCLGVCVSVCACVFNYSGLQSLFPSTDYGLNNTELFLKWYFSNFFLSEIKIGFLLQDFKSWISSPII